MTLLEIKNRILGFDSGLSPSSHWLPDNTGKNWNQIVNIIESQGDLQNWYNYRLTMLPQPILENIEYCIRECVLNNIEGDFVETGVWKGGSVIFAYNILKEVDPERKVYSYDSYEGLPKPDVDTYPMDNGDDHWTHTELSISLEDVKKNFELFSEIDESVIFVKGWFRDTIPVNDVKKICILRLDGDMYESTILALDYLYPKLSIGGFCIIDDFVHPGARAAVDDYRNKHNITDEFILIDPDTPEKHSPTGIAQGTYPTSYWIKTK